VASKTHTTSVVLIPPDEAWPPIQRIRREHDRHLWRWMPHITLLYPFRPVSEFEAVAAELAVVCSGIRPIQVELVRFGCFSHGRSNYTLWLAPEPASELVRLQTALWRCVPDCDDTRRYPSGYTPHLSVGQARGEEQAAALQRALQAAWAPLRFQAAEVSLIYRNEPPDDVFRIAEQVLLGPVPAHTP
jgi:2'-5' RNA ligase